MTSSFTMCSAEVLIGRTISIHTLAVLTLVLGHAHDLGEQLNKVWEIIAKELGTDYEVLAGVVAEEL